jgi:hypothetical protein
MAAKGYARPASDVGGGLTADMKTMNGPDLWAIVARCPEGIF